MQNRTKAGSAGERRHEKTQKKTFEPKNSRKDYIFANTQELLVVNKTPTSVCKIISKKHNFSFSWKKSKVKRLT